MKTRSRKQTCACARRRGGRPARGPAGRGRWGCGGGGGKVKWWRRGRIGRAGIVYVLASLITEVERREGGVRRKGGGGGDFNVQRRSRSPAWRAFSANAGRRCYSTALPFQTRIRIVAGGLCLLCRCRGRRRLRRRRGGRGGGW